MDAIKQDDLPKVSELIKQVDLPAIMVKERKWIAAVATGSVAVLQNRDAPTERATTTNYPLSTLYLPGPIKRDKPEQSQLRSECRTRIKAMFVVRDADSVYQRDQEGEKKANAKGKAKHHKNSADAAR